MLNKKTKILS